MRTWVYIILFFFSSHFIYLCILIFVIFSKFSLENEKADLNDTAVNIIYIYCNNSVYTYILMSYSVSLGH